ncbi:MAG: hypothetical protein HN816_16205 [Gammaproteobacteria bacterium]|mgnify:CR=1 FL=1|nr:hypothetical protein [Gammaproteobacteria bacterium]
MTIPMWCMLAGLILPYVWHGASVPFRLKQFDAIDAAKPREQADRLTDAGYGAWGAQLNAWEALAVFTVANVIAFMGGVDPAGNWSLAAIIWVAVRFLHGVFYIANIPPLRILCFTTGLAMSIWIIAMAM